MKRIALSLLTIAFVTMLATSATRAYLSDTADISSNTFSSGTLDLKVNGNDSATQAYQISNLKPGDWNGAGQVILKNAGTITGHAWLEITNVVNQENGCTAPEVLAGDTTCGTNEGELGQFAVASFQENQAPWTRYGSTTTPINSAANTRIDIEDLAPGQSLPLYLYAVWSPTANDNLAQGDSVTFDVVVHLDQVH